MLVAPLGDTQIILGTVWLSQFGPTLWDFKRHTLKFWRHGSPVIFKGTSPSNIEVIDREVLKKMMQVEGVAVAIQLLSAEVDENSTEWPEDLRKMLKEFEDVFQTLKKLPPKRSSDYHIPLLHPNQAISARPYRYPFFKKNEIERQIQEMLQTGIIRPSSCPFASPVALVKKSDGSWRLCMDYRSLNQDTMKDKFLIPLIDDLLDELFGARYFSKLNLCSGYHQVRVAEEDIPTTAFKHNAHYEFLVMPFGLTNTLSTFQNLMNDQFRP